MKLIIAEKPDVARKFRDALKIEAKAVKFKEMVYYYEGKGYIFASAAGHLFTLQQPQEINEDNKTWTMDRLDLPRIIPLRYGQGYAKDYFACLKKLVSRADVDEIIVATDPDREGQLIWSLIARQLKTDKYITRAWIKEWTPNGLLKAFKERKPNEQYANLELAGLCRMQADYVIGMHATRANTVAFGGYKTIINEGRVQSPTRYIVYQNDKSIKEFVPQKYNVIEVELSSDEKDNHLILTGPKMEPETAAKVVQFLPHNWLINKTTKQTKKGCPRLYATSDIQIEVSKKLGLTVDETTNILQKLYQDYALTTYPRTSINQISQSSAKDAMKIINTLDGVGIADDIIKEIKSKNLHIQKHLISSESGDMPHEAITPTFDGNPRQNIDKLNKNELAVYKMIVKRFLQGFYPPATIEETNIESTIDCNNEKYIFKTSGKVVIDPSWMKINGVPSDSFLPVVTEGNIYELLTQKTLDKMTTPPARLTEATLLEIMKSPTKLVSDKDAQKVLKETEGIGTEATRNGIINKLFANGFLERKGKAIYPTEKTIEVIETQPKSALTDPILTAELEAKLAEVEKGTRTFDSFMEDTYRQVDDILLSIKKAPHTKIASVSKNANINIIGKCPCCGSDIVEREKGYGCSNKDCDFIIWKTVASKKITEKNAKDLLVKGETSLIRNFKSKTGKPFNAYLVMKDNKMEFKFENSFSKKDRKNKNNTENTKSIGKEEGKRLSFKCPYCNGAMKEYNSRYSCSNHDFVIWKTVAGKEIKEIDAKRICDYGYTNIIKGFKSKAGKPFDAVLRRNNITKKIEFDFVN